MATVETEDSNLLFQFNSPVDSPGMFFQGPGPDKVSDDSASTLVNAGFEGQHTLFTVPTLSKPQGLNEAKTFSYYNNYLSERLKKSREPSEARRLEPQPQPPRTSTIARDELQLRKQKLEELVELFWLKDGEIDESIFEDSSDEEGL